MKNKLFRLIAGVALVSASISAGSQTAVRDYVNLRSKAVDAIHAQYSDQGNERLSRVADKSLQAVRTKLKELVGPIDVTGFPRGGESILGSREDDQYEGLDGIAATSLDKKTKLFVTTVPLMRAWLASHHKEVKSYSSLQKLLGTEVFYNATAAISGEAAVYAYGEIPVTIRGDGSIARAILFALGQDDPAPNPPDSIAVTVMRNERIYIFTEEAKVGNIPGCAESSRDASIGFEQCFAKRLPSQSTYPRLTGQAQSLVDRILPPQRH
ncbi:hypothetical protein [Burkholderia ubonensis]|uniref:hypothetical protein n=1 Tax=Burkholderia ubonensis TaxID=101571 RepID=UPI000AB92BC2|nr:hypothetical protein [Burkholderia ubonensis]